MIVSQPQVCCRVLNSSERSNPICAAGSRLLEVSPSFIPCEKIIKAGWATAKTARLAFEVKQPIFCCDNSTGASIATRFSGSLCYQGSYNLAFVAFPANLNIQYFHATCRQREALYLERQILMNLAWAARPKTRLLA